MADKIYQVWAMDDDYAKIWFASADYTATVNFVVDLIIKFEDETCRRFAAKRNRRQTELATLNAQIAALQTLSDNEAIKPILDELVKEQEMENGYARWLKETDFSVKTADYYKQNLDKYCIKYGIAIIDFDADTEINIDVQSCIDELVP